MITGRKLLLADDSIAIQKVIDLTFTDEGMEVTTVGDGQDALDKLNQFTPDVVLADVFMPGVDGYELCKFIKKDERFRGVPVMLLVGSFEPFDEAEAKRAGADDVVTKPFQSIRDLVSRVGSLVSHEGAARQETADKFSLLGLTQTEEKPADETAVAEESEAAEQADVRVFVEAPSMEPDATVFVEAPLMEIEPTAMPEHTCPPVIDLQTADTKQLEPISTEATRESERFELRVAEEESSATPAQAEFLTVLPPRESAQVKFDDEGVLDLGDIDGFAAAPSEDDFVLDVEVEPVTISSAPIAPVIAPVTESAPIESDRSEITQEFSDGAESSFATVDEPVLTRVTDEPSVEVSAAPLLEPVQTERSQTSGLSSDEIEAISRRVVEQMSDKVVREIAWEVVPELSELLIKRRLEERS
ncbi:MAG TPA: response regulator [Pyrinomonadaceae bacterium]|nr:response regulator [Pyrinomonadaceae bacterium]